MRLLTALLTRSNKSRAPFDQPRARRSLAARKNAFRRRLLFLEQLEDRRLLATFDVLNTNDSGAGSLRQAIVDANVNIGNDIIQFDSGVNGTITLISGELGITDSVDLQGPGASVVTVSGNNTSRVFYVSANATISGLTISGGNANDGGGILNYGTLTVDGSTLSGNSAGGVGGSNGAGGGIFNYGTLTVDSSTLSGNSASYEGGGIYNRSEGMLTVHNSTFSGNSGFYYGGGIDNYGMLTVDGSTFSGNSAGVLGGGIYNYSGSATATVQNSTLSANTANNSGGGIFNGNSATLTVDSSTLSGNRGGEGGGIANGSSGNAGTVTVHNSTLSGNLAGQGGGIYNYGTLTVDNSTLSGNMDFYGGGGLYTRGTSTLDNTIVAANLRVNGTPNDIDGAVAGSSAHNLIGVDLNLTGISNGTSGNQIGTSAAPINPLLGALQNNGGPTATMAILLGSPAINAGDNSLIPVGITTDQRGAGYARIDSAIVDIGAFELVLNRPPVANAGGPYSITEGSSLLLNGSGSYDPDPLDTLTYSWDVNGDGVFGDAIGVSPTLTWAQLQAIGINDGPRTVPNVRVRVDDGHAHIVNSPVTTLTVTNVAPSVGAITAPLDPRAVNTTISVSAAFTDPGTLDTHTAVWDWGDGSSMSAGTVTETNGSGSVSGSHAYAAAGVYTVRLTVKDDDGDSGSSVSQQFVVVYDPAAGFVTGGGWINSPAGAYRANTALTGKATFGFVSKYQNGATVPTGNTEFQFKVADFNFKSTSYEWLVVSGAKARFRGVGTVNGAGSYGFELTAWDGQVNGGGGVDKFRIKIWLGNQGNPVVYDNNIGAADGADPTTALGGSIVIHKNAQPLLASGGVGLGKAEGTLTQLALDQAVDQAIDLWGLHGMDADAAVNLKEIHVELADLAGAELGIASDTNYVWIDRDAAGYGWQLNSLSGIYPSLAGGMDLLSVVAHELGHKLGLEHNHDDSDIMAPTLDVGVRTAVGSVGQPFVFVNASFVVSGSIQFDGTRPSLFGTLRLPNEDFKENHARDQLFANLDDGATKPLVRSRVIASKSQFDAKQITNPDDDDLFEEYFLDTIALAQLATHRQNN